MKELIQELFTNKDYVIIILGTSNFLLGIGWIVQIMWVNKYDK